MKRFPLVPTICLALVFVVPGTSLEGTDNELPRTSWGTPDIGGVWDFRVITPLERPPELAEKATLTPEEAKVFLDQALALLDVDNRVGDSALDVEGAYNSFWWDWGTELTEDLRTSLIVDPSNGRLPPLTPAARERMAEQNRLRTPPVRDLFSYSADPQRFRPEGPESVGLSERCLKGFNAGPPIAPSAYNNNLRILQTPKYIVLLTEMIHDARIIPMDGRPHLASDIERWSGDSRGQWEGDTLVVETTNFSDKVPTFQLPADFEDGMESGAVGSARNMTLIERFTRQGDKRLLYEYTLSDPQTFETPFTVAIPLRASEGPLYEYACHEGNYAMRGMLKGARLLEAEDASSGVSGSSKDD